jgi:hypothetical protein
VLAPIILPQTGCLASKLVFGPNGLVLGSSMDLIPTEMGHESNPSYYQLSADITVIHRRITSYKTLQHWLTHLLHRLI